MTNRELGEKYSEEPSEKEAPDEVSVISKQDVLLLQVTKRVGVLENTIELLTKQIQEIESLLNATIDATVKALSN